MIVRVSLVDFFHRLRVSLGAGFMIQFLRIAVKSCDGGDVRFLARSDGSVGGRRLVNFVKTALDYFGVRFIPKLVPQAHGNTPVCHGATRIIDGDLGELLFSFFVPEGMKQSHAALERLLHGRCAGNWKHDRA